MRVLEIEGLVKSFSGLTVIDGISTGCARGEVLCVIGPSGSGKSTLLRCINHLVRPDRGIVFVSGEMIGYERRHGRLIERSERAIARQRRAIGMVFQRFNLYQHLNALENVSLAPRVLYGKSRSESRDLAAAQLARVGLADKQKSYPRELSGGQQQRVAIARALAMQPTLMLFDEPTSALDPELVGEVLTTIEALAESGMTMLVVTHELGFARQAGSHLIFLDNGQIIEEGNPAAVLGSPASERLRAFTSKVIR